MAQFIPKQGFRSLAGERIEHHEHVVHFYDRDDQLCVKVADFLGAGLAAGEPILVIATPSHRAAVAARLEHKGLDLAKARQAGLSTFLDAEEVLAQIMVGPVDGPVDGRVPSPERFRQVVGGELATFAARSRNGRVHAYGEMVDVLWSRGNTHAAILLEDLWNELQRQRPFALLCAYAMAGFYNESTDLRRVCAVHGRVVSPAASEALDVSGVHSTAERSEEAQALANEVARRKDIEKALRETLREVLRTDEALRQSQAELREFVDNAAVGLHWVGSDGTILWANRAELELLGYEADEYVGHNIAEFHADSAVIDDVLSRLRKNEAIRDYEARLRTKDGGIRHVALSSSALIRDGQLAHTRCFTRDITERKRAEEALLENQRRLQLITDALPVLISYVDADKRYRFVNDAYQRWFGIPRDDIIGKRMDQLVGADGYALLRAHVEAALGGDVVTFQATVPYPHAGERSVEATYVPHLGASGRPEGFVTLVADITERTRLQRQREAASRRTERLMKVTAAIADAVTPAQVREAVVDEVARAIDASSAGLFTLSEDGKTVTLVRSLGYPPRAEEFLRSMPLDREPSLPTLDVIRSGEPLWIASQREMLARYPHLAATVTPSRAYCIACMPLRAQGRTAAVLGLTFENAPLPDDDDRASLFMVARYAGQALERLRLLEAEQRSRELAEASAARMAVLGRAAAALATSNDPALSLQRLTEEISGEYCDGCALHLVDEAGEVFELAAASHIDAEIDVLWRSGSTHPRAQPGRPMLGRDMARGDSILLPTVDVTEVIDQLPATDREWILRAPPASLMCVPLQAHGKLLGVLALVRHAPRPGFGHDDLQLVEELARRAALAIDASRMQKDRERARLRAELLHELAAVMIAAESVDEIYQAALDAIERGLGTDRSAILVFDDNHVMKFVAWRGLSDYYRAAVEGHSPWSSDTRAPEPILVSDVVADPAMSPFMPLFRHEQIGGIGFIPLVAAGRLLGKFMVYYPRPYKLSPHEIDTARGIANHVAASIARFQAVAELQETVRFNEVFTGILGHDLRNPLGAIMTSAQLAIRRGESERLVKPLSRVLASGDRMARMIDQLLDFTRTRVGGGIPIEPTSVDLVPIVRAVMDELDDANPAFSLELNYAGNTEGVWDGDRLSQVFSNLVANAVQHGVPEHGVDVCIDGTAEDRVRVEVHNMGAVPPEVLPKVFEPMTGGQRRRDKSNGLGLGLHITHEILRAHGGSVRVHSTEAEGTSFVVTLPRAARIHEVPPR